jgi:hypothetical protein
MNCETCKAKIPTLHTRLVRVNADLYQLGLEYRDTLSYSLNAIDRILLANGFVITSGSIELAICTGINGQRHIEVGEGKWLSLSWYRLDSGRYEIVAYVN